MNRGPMSRLVKVPVKCKNCGKIKYNVVCKDDLPEDNEIEKPIETKPEVKQKENTENTVKVYKKPQQYNYIKAVVKKQNQMVNNAYNTEDSKK